MGMTAVPSVLPESNLDRWVLARKFHMAEGGVTTSGMINARTGRWDYLHKWPWPDMGLAEGEVTSLDIHQRATGWWDAGQHWPADMGLAGFASLDEGENTSAFMKHRATGWWDYEYYPWLETDIGLAGLGQIDLTATTAPPYYVAAPGQSCDPYTDLATCVSQWGGGGPPVTSSVIMPSQTDPNWNSVMQQLIKSGFNLAQIMSIQPGTVVSGNQILRQAPGYPVSMPVTSTTAGLNVGANVSTGAGAAFGGVAILGLGLIAIMMLSRRD